MRWFSALAGLALSIAVVSGAAAQQGPVHVEVTVVQISDAPGGIDARGQKLHDKLKGQFRYESLKVLETRGLSLALDQVGSVSLPNGKSVRVSPVQLDAESTLLAVDVEGAVQTDLRVRNGHLVVIGADRHQGGKLVVGLEPRW